MIQRLAPGRPSPQSEKLHPKDGLIRTHDIVQNEAEFADWEKDLMANKRLVFGGVTSFVAVVILYLMAFRSSLGIAGADPGAPQMMGGMGNRQGMGGMMGRMMGNPVPPGVKPQDLPAPDSKGAKLTIWYCMQCHNLASHANR